MSDYDPRPPRRGDDGYTSSRYTPPRHGYDRETPYDTLYKRSYDTPTDDTRSSAGSYRPSSHHHRQDRYDEDNDSYYRDQRQLSRQRDNYSDSYGGSAVAQRPQSGYDDYEDQSQYSRGTQEHGEEEKRRLSGLVGKEKKDVAATLIGAAAGALLGHEAGHGKGFGTIGGAVLGGLSANAMEHRHLKRQEQREEEEGEDRSSSRHSHHHHRRDDY